MQVKRVVAGTLDSARLLVPTETHLVSRLDMWLNQYSYLNGRKVWISQLAAPLRLGSLMQTVQAPNHDPTVQFLPEYGELVRIDGHMVEIEFRQNQRRFVLTMKSVLLMPNMSLCTITNVRRSALQGRVVTDVTRSITEAKNGVPAQEMEMRAILAARGTPTGRSWAFLGFHTPSSGG